jgi:phosphatidate cytidylyltransferase
MLVNLPFSIAWSMPTLPPPVLWTLVGVYGLLVIATAIIAGLGWSQPEGDYGELRHRIQSWWVMVSVFTLALVLNRTGLPMYSLGSSVSWRCGNICP